MSCAHTHTHIHMLYKHNPIAGWPQTALVKPQWKLKLHNWKDSSQRNPFDYSVLPAPSKQLCSTLTGQAACLLSFWASNRQGQLINTVINRFTANRNWYQMCLAACGCSAQEGSHTGVGNLTHPFVTNVSSNTFWRKVNDREDGRNLH